MSLRANDVRYGQVLRELFVDCPVFACHRGPGANIYTATVRGPDGRQRTVLGCVDHLGLEVGRALSLLRLEPFD